MKKITWVFPVWIAIGFCLIMAGVSMFKEDKKSIEEQKRAYYNQGWRDAVLDCYDKKILQGPIILTGPSPTLLGNKITVVNITVPVEQPPVILVSNATYSTIANCSVDYSSIVLPRSSISDKP